MGGRGSRSTGRNAQVDFVDERGRAVELCVRIDDRALLLSQAAYWPNRTSESDHAKARAAEQQNRKDLIAVRRFVRWALEHHAAAMCAWAESAVTLACTDAYTRGWEQVLQAWRAGSPQPDEPRAHFPWLVTLWHRTVA